MIVLPTLQLLHHWCTSFSGNIYRQSPFRQSLREHLAQHAAYHVVGDVAGSCSHATTGRRVDMTYMTLGDWASVFDCVTAVCFLQWWSLCDCSVFLPVVVPFTSLSAGSAGMLALHHCCIFSSSGTQVDCIVGIGISLLMYAATVVSWVWQIWLFFDGGWKVHLQHMKIDCTIRKHTAPYENRLHHTET